MAARVKEVIDWLSELDPTDFVAVDEGGLALAHLPKDFTGLAHEGADTPWASFDVGGIPLEDDMDGETLESREGVA